jgi:hypothetical protein
MVTLCRSRLGTPGNPLLLISALRGTRIISSSAHGEAGPDYHAVHGTATSSSRCHWKISGSWVNTVLSWLSDAACGCGSDGVPVLIPSGHGARRAIWPA